MQSVDWDVFRYIVAVADSGSAVAAASHLGVNPSTVLRKISRFESENGVRLFERSQNGFTPTVECAAVVEVAREMQQSVIEIGHGFLGRDFRLEGTVSVTTTDTLLATVLAPAIKSFCDLHPRIRVDVTVTNRRLNLTRHDADVAIRASIRPPETLYGQRVSGLSFAIYAEPTIAADLDSDATLSQLQRLRWIGFGETFGGTPVAAWVAENVPVEAVGLRADTFTSIRDCALAGAGLAVLPCCLADTEPGLVRIGKPIEAAETSLWVLTHADIKNAARIKAFTAHVARFMRSKSALLEGRFQSIRPAAKGPSSGP